MISNLPVAAVTLISIMLMSVVMREDIGYNFLSFYLSYISSGESHTVTRLSHMHMPGRCSAASQQELQ